MATPGNGPEETGTHFRLITGAPRTRELTGAVDLVSHRDYHEKFCQKPLPASIGESRYLKNVVGDIDIRKGEGMELGQLLGSDYEDLNGHMHQFDIDNLQQASTLRESGSISLPEVKVLREVVHSLCQVTNPLGKAIDFLKEDTETMIKEQQFWIKDQKVHQNRLDEERRITEEMLQDEAGKLTELEEKIKYQQRRIFSLKGEILQNDETIMKYLKMVTAPTVDFDLESLLDTQTKREIP